MSSTPILRVARPSDNLDALLRFYRDGLGLILLDRFEDHNGFDGIMLGREGAPYHFEFTRARGHSAGKAPTQDNLLVFYIPESAAWQAAVRRMRDAGFVPVPAFNPYWDGDGVTFQDPDGYRVVLQRGAWNVEGSGLAFTNHERRIHIESYHADRGTLLPLFVLADDSDTQVSTYISIGEVLTARDDDAIIGHLQIIETDDPGVFELKSMAVNEGRQGEGIGCSLVDAAVVHCRSRDGHRLIVSTAAADIDNLRFYQRRGFRMSRVVQDVFGPSTGYVQGTMVGGIPLRDQVFLELELYSDRFPGDDYG